ncbi:hypothetical protein HR45_03880 [Shewanella mangrovi]|uniref:Uncharacterized protein n=1 Tax=Shewanella mangrovi TaxID=1515746 RepID=A0A094JH60_9GAMM|nr:hypothetical protein [Shewanella mangrovi]KFZ38572.1 hypothetical protein HR45_03880 [Shewanella mangrovi]
MSDDNQLLLAKQRKQQYLKQAIADYHLALFGDYLAERHKYKDLFGHDAIRFYLCVKHNYTPAQAQQMSSTELRFLLNEEMRYWTPPTDLAWSVS